MIVAFLTGIAVAAATLLDVALLVGLFILGFDLLERVLDRSLL